MTNSELAIIIRRVKGTKNQAPHDDGHLRDI
nr:MAG TPA: hypothetical protein [Bacteriophage sp.]